MAPGSSFAHLDFIVIIPEGFFVVPELCCEIGQHPNVSAVVAAVFPLAAPYYRGNKLVLVNKSATSYDKKAALVIAENIGEVFRKVVLED